MIRRDPSLFLRLVGLIGLLLAGITAVLLVAAADWGRTAADEAFDRVLIGAALQIAEDIAIEDGKPVVDMPVSAFEMLALADRDRIFYRVVDASGATVTGDDRLDLGRDMERAGRGPIVVAREFSGEPVRVALVERRLAEPGLAGPLRVLVAQTEIARATLGHTIAVRVVALVAGLAVLAFLAAVVAIRIGLAPLARVAQVLGERDPNDLTALTIATPRELRPFARSINHFMERLAERMALLERFIADAAHQIRTPLTAITAQVDLLSRGSFEGRDRERVQRIKERTEELGRLTNQILAHAMIIHRTDTVAFVAVDLVAIARRALIDGVPASLPRDVVVALEAPDGPVTIDGEPVALREAVVNVVDNAVRHGAPGHLTVRVLEEPGAVVVEVEDDGPGIPPEDWARVTTRFGARAGETRVSGLGFAIAADVCRAHGGRLEFRAPGPGGFAVRLVFPIREGTP